MVRVYAFDISNMPDPKEDESILLKLSEKRKEKVLRCSQLKGRKETAGAGLLLKEVFKLHGYSENDIFYGDSGKPQLDGFYFNLSHTEGLVICAVADSDIGCDIEKTSKNQGRIAQRYYTKKEQEYLASCSEKEKPDTFFRIWTAKESYIKMTGEGMKVPLQSLEIDFQDNLLLYRDNKLENCHLKEYEIGEYRICICTKDDTFQDEIVFTDCEVFAPYR